MQMHTRSGALKRGVRSLLLVVSCCCLTGLAAFTLPGCEDVGAASDRDAQRVSEVQSPRIAALLPFAADQLLAMGIRPVAVPSVIGGGPDSWGDIAIVTLDHSAGPNIEQLLATEPEIIVTSAVYAQFLPIIEQSTGAKTVVMDVHSIEDIQDNIQMLASLAGEPMLADAHLRDLDAITGIERDAQERPVRMLAIFGTPHSFYAFLPSSYLGDLVELAGGELITSDMESHNVYRGFAPISMEIVIDRAPEHIIVVFHGPEESARAMLANDPLWAGLEAFQNDQVTYLTDDLYAMRPGSDFVRAAEQISTIVESARSADQ